MASNVLEPIKPTDYISNLRIAKEPIQSVSSWYLNETIELNFGDSVGRPDASITLQREYLARFLENGWSVDAVLKETSGGVWETSSSTTAASVTDSSDNANKSASQSAVDTTAQKSTETASSTGEEKSESSSADTTRETTSGHKAGNSSSANSSESTSNSISENNSTENYNATFTDESESKTDSTEDRRDDSNSIYTYNETARRTSSSSESSSNKNNYSSGSSGQSVETLSTGGTRTSASSSSNSQSQSSSSNSRSSSDDNTNRTENKEEHSIFHGEKHDTTNNNRTTRDSRTTTNTSTNQSNSSTGVTSRTSGNTSESSGGSTSSAKQGTNNSSKRSSSNSGTDGTLTKTGTTTGSSSEESNSLGHSLTSSTSTTTQGGAAYWSVCQKIRLKRRRMQPEKVLQSMVTSLTNAYNEGRGIEANRYNELVSLYSVMLSRNESEGADIVNNAMDLQPLLARVEESIKISIGGAEGASLEIRRVLTVDAENDINRQFDSLVSQQRAQMITNGMYNSVIWPSVQAGIERQRSAALVKAKAEAAQVSVNAESQLAQIKASAWSSLLAAQQNISDAMDKRKITVVELRNTVLKWMIDYVGAKEELYPQLQEIPGVTERLGFSVGSSGNIL